MQLQAPPHSGSEFYNHKGFHSIVLMALCNANYLFTLVDIGDSGHNSDGGIFANCTFGKKFLNEEMNTPPDEQLPNSSVTVPYHIVGDAAFPLKKNIMRPFPGKNLNHEEKVFNYRLSRCRLMQCTGVFCSKICEITLFLDAQ